MSFSVVAVSGHNFYSCETRPICVLETNGKMRKIMITVYLRELCPGLKTQVL